MTGIPSAVTDMEGATLQRWARGRQVLEVGSLLGRSTVLLAEVAAHVIALDPHEGYPRANPRPTLQPFLANLEQHGVRGRVTPMIGTDNALAYLRPATFGLAFIDATGEYEDTRRIMERVAPLLAQSAVLAVHDCGHPEWPGALEAVNLLATQWGVMYRLTERLATFENVNWRDLS